MTSALLQRTWFEHVFAGFVFVLDKSFVRHLYLLTPVKRLLL